MVRDPELLPEDKDGFKLGSKEFAPPVTKTFCNIAVERIFQALEYDKLFGKMANDIYEYCYTNWSRCCEEDAVTAAKMGDLVLACWKNPNGHGHVAVVYPSGNPMIYSGKWKVYCPWVANIGKSCGIEGANQAFGDRPEYFRLMRTIQ